MVSSNLHPQRDTLRLETAEILSHEGFAGEQYVMRLQAPEIAALAQPGQFVHLQVHPMQPMRRPISLMRADAQTGWIEILYKVVGEGTRLLSQRERGQSLSLLGPIGVPFKVEVQRPLLLGGGVGMPPMVFLADRLRTRADCRPFVVLGSEVPFPFTPRPSQILVDTLPEGVIAAMPLLDDWGVASRLASLRGFPGCHRGYLTDLARHWLDGLEPDQRQQVAVFACGPHPMLQAATELARAYGLPVQLSLEEYMACGLGGCAGCTVEIDTAGRRAMRRVCVDGPVFDGYSVFPG